MSEKQVNPLLDKKVINAFVDGVKEVLTQMAGTSVTLLKPEIQEKFQSSGDVAGMIGMLSGSMKGTITISFQAKAAFQIIENMLGETHTEVNNEVADAVGELTNMIYGNAKTTLNKLGYGFEMAIPTVITGPYKITSYHEGATLVVPFEMPNGSSIYVEITVQI